MHPKHVVNILVLLAVMLSASPAYAGGVVSVCDEVHLRAALAGGGTVTFSCSGTILLAAEIVMASNTTLDGTGQNVTISGNDAVRVFYVNSGVTLNLNRLTIADGSVSDESGGGIYNNGGTLTVTNSTLSGNRSSSVGGGIRNDGTLTVTNSTLSDNSATNAGGGIFNYNSATLTVTNSTLSGNSANAGGGIFNYYNGTLTVTNSALSGNSANAGGGINNSGGGTVTVTNSTLSGNSATNDDGGGIYNSGTLTVTNSTLSGNSASHYGGAIYNDYFGTVTVTDSTLSGNSMSQSGSGGGIKNDGALTVTDSTLSGNSASQGGYGGGIYNDGALTVTNSTLAGNSATNNGGGVYNDTGTLTVTNSTLSANLAYDGGGIYNGYIGTVTVTNCTLSANYGGGISNGSAVTLKNTIVANSQSGDNCSGQTITDGDGNLSYPDTTCPGINGDPVLGLLQNNGGPTQTIALLTDSAALGAGNDATCAAPPVNNLDQRGVIRPHGPHCDIGAVEQLCANFVPPATVGVEDIQAIAVRWGWTNSTPGWDPAYDLNGDNRIDIFDLMSTTAAFGTTCL